MIKKIAVAVVAFQLVASVVFADLISPVGKWKSIDDETKEPKSIIEISEMSGKLSGKVVQLFRKPPQDLNPLCDQCEGDKKNQPIIGMT